MIHAFDPLSAAFVFGGTMAATLLRCGWRDTRAAIQAVAHLVAPSFDSESVRATLAQPLTATLMLAFVVSAFWHARLGVQVVIEDYVHTPALEFAAQIAVNFACALGAIASIVAIGRIAFTA